MLDEGMLGQIHDAVLPDVFERHVYSLDKQLAEGQGAENHLDRFFSTWFDITESTRQQQREGIDRIWVRKDSGCVITVEYKADSTAARTGNIFIETVSVDTAKKLGWAYTSRAQELLYYIPPLGKAYLVPMSLIKRQLPAWHGKYPTRRIPNKGRLGDTYHTVGILVALSVFERECQPDVFTIAAGA